ncbi:MAG: terpene cyclase/mutase family protein [Planctomycetes bacterium]|nr:terpene cyclase/mutase family protein [Planctomycetota bacterium]
MYRLDPTQIHVESHALPAWEHDASFHDTMAEQLRRAPWLALSASAHALAALLLWLLIPPEVKRAAENFASIVDTTQFDAVEPPPPPPPETNPEEIVEPIEVAETTIANEPDHAFDQVPTESNAKESTFDADQWNAAIGIGSGAGGPIGSGQGNGPGRRSGPNKPFVPDMRAALDWLRNHQDDDGKWDCDQFMKHDRDGEVCDGAGNPVHDIGVTGLALLAFLGDGSTLRSGPYRDALKKGVIWLKNQQDPSTGLFGRATSHDFVYDHAIATYAMCEAYGLSDYQMLKDTAQKGLDYLEAHRNPYRVWRYQPRDNDNDTSITGWCIMAYESASYFGLTVNREALKICASWLDEVADTSGRHGYAKAGDRSSRKPGDHGTRFPADKSEAMTAVGLFCRFFLGQDPKEKPVMRAAADLLVARPPVWDPKAGTIDEYYWYYATYALFQMGGSHWEAWKKKIAAAVQKNQHRDPAKKHLLGSWDPIGCWGEDGGRVYSTAILALTLQATYRYSKIVH